ncbi:hypothetical protein Agabi119p4_10443 [Agaricus bisporus var. burnettii]|uniref:WSC domain-containing protein n=1 Tax=Agaricus bisporus var. burnettii TaxID=192524 RepID=A0A8H7EWE8_AGABI|nr:hypothetical protein Agabi119p4_10443 [Agaricus bisporus var. burnettii]
MGLLTPTALALAIAFAPLTLSNAQATHRANHNVFRHRRQSIPTTLPGNWSSLGCYTDNVASGRTLNAAATASGDSMTTESCINFCDSKGYIYAGTEYGVSVQEFMVQTLLLFLFLVWPDPKPGIISNESLSGLTVPCVVRNPGASPYLLFPNLRRGKNVFTNETVPFSLST